MGTGVQERGAQQHNEAKIVDLNVRTPTSFIVGLLSNYFTRQGILLGILRGKFEISIRNGGFSREDAEVAF
jgi:hypothetical protein